MAPLYPIKVDDPYSGTFLIRTPNGEWYVVRSTSKNIYKTKMCFKKMDYVLIYDNRFRFNN